MKQLFTLFILVLMTASLPNLLVAGDAGSRPSYLFRLDYHNGALNPWLFYEAPVTPTIGLLSVFQMSTRGYAQIDLGPCFHAGSFQLIPQIGAEFVETGSRGTRLGHVAPELYLLHFSPNFSFESWNLYFIKVDEEQISTIYYRDHFVCRLYKNIFVGPQAEGYVFPGRNPENYIGAHVDVDTGAGVVGCFYGWSDRVGLMRMTFSRIF